MFDAQQREPPEWLLGGSETHVLVYAADPIEADSSWGVFLGAEYSAGYHLVRVVFGTRCGIPRFYVDDTEGDSEGAAVGDSVSADTSEGQGSETPAEPLPPLDEPDYTGIPFVCGNGVCEQGETCDTCSDCVACDGETLGASSGLTSRDRDYYCLYTPSSFAPAPAGTEAEIELLIASPELIDWPAL